MRLSSFAAACAALALATPAFAASEQIVIRTGEDLVAMCGTAPDSPNYVEANSFCHGYTSGAYHFYAVWTEKDPSRHFVCIKEPYPRRDTLIREMVAWGKANPEYLKDSGIDLIFRFLGQRFPCAK